jgi:hypothetical protein
MAIAACFAFQREISSSVLRDFFDSIGQKAKYSLRADRCERMSSGLPLEADIWRAGWVSVLGRLGMSENRCAD